MRCKFFLFLVALIGLGVTLEAQITVTNNLSSFEESLENLNDSTLVIFDVDDVLITCKDPVLQPANKERLERVCEQYAQKLTQSEYLHLYSSVMRSREVEVTDQKIYDLLEFLESKNVKTVALTHSRTGRFGVIDKMEDWRLEELNHLGIAFEKSSPFQQEAAFKNLSGPMGTPNIKKGVIFTAELEKGAVLKEAFKLMNPLPQKVIFIDDRLDNLESIANFCQNLGIDFEGFQYTAIQSRPIKYVDEKLIEIQLDTLMREERWISSEEAAEAFDDEHA